MLVVLLARVAVTVAQTTIAIQAVRIPGVAWQVVFIRDIPSRGACGAGAGGG